LFQISVGGGRAVAVTTFERYAALSPDPTAPLKSDSTVATHGGL